MSFTNIRTTREIRKIWEENLLPGGCSPFQKPVALHGMQKIYSGIAKSSQVLAIIRQSPSVARQELTSLLSFDFNFDLGEVIPNPKINFETINPQEQTVSVHENDIYIKTHHQLTSASGEYFDVTELIPKSGRTNGKTVVLSAGLGMSVEAYYRIGEESTGESLLKHYLNHGFRVVMVDFPGIGKNVPYPSKNNSVDAMVDEILPSLMKFLALRKEAWHPRGIYFVAHSLGGVALNLFIDRYVENIKQYLPVQELLKNVFTMGTPEAPLADAHALYPLILSLLPWISRHTKLDSIPYQKLNKIFGPILSPKALIADGLFSSMISFDSSFPPALAAELLVKAVKPFAMSLALWFVSSFQHGFFSQHSHRYVLTSDQRHFACVGDFDPLGTSEALYWALSQTIKFYLGVIARPVTLTGISLEQDISNSWLSSLELAPVRGFVFERMSHAEISVVNKRFMQQVWPIMLEFLEEQPMLSAA